MSPGPADQVNAKELAARAAVLERHLGLDQLARVAAAGGLEGTRIDAQVRFGTFDRRVTVQVNIEGVVVLECQRCLQPCECAVEESASLMVVPLDTDVVPDEYEPLLGSAESLSLAEAIEEQVLLAMPLVPAHADAARCAVKVQPQTVAAVETATQAAEDKQMPFANLREMLEGKGERGPATGE
jgi:uncharacterized protein